MRRHAQDRAMFNTTSGEAVARSKADRHRELAIRYQDLLKDIRKQPGYQDFLSPPQISSLLPFIERLDGPVIFINVHSSSCDALALFPNGGIRHVVLPDLTEKKAQDMRSTWDQLLRSDNLRMRGTVPLGRLIVQRRANMYALVLQQLWVRVAHPILEALGFVSSITTSFNKHQ